MSTLTLPKANSKMTGVKFLAKVAKSTGYGELYLLLVKLCAALETISRIEEPNSSENIRYEEPDYNN